MRRGALAEGVGALAELEGAGVCADGAVAFGGRVVEAGA